MLVKCLCVKCWRRSGEWSRYRIIKVSTGDPVLILANILQTAACRGIYSPPLFLSPPLLPPPPPLYSLLRPPLFSVFTPRSFGGASIILQTSSFRFSYSTRTITTSVLMSRRERRTTKWSYQTNSVGTNSWFWQQHLCHLQSRKCTWESQESCRRWLHEIRQSCGKFFA